MSNTGDCRAGKAEVLTSDHWASRDDERKGIKNLFQYGNPDAVCSPLINAKKNVKDLVETYG